MTDLNPLKKRKKIVNNTEDKNVDLNVTGEKDKDDDQKGPEDEPENKNEETLDEAEKSEAENVNNSNVVLIEKKV